MAAKKKTKKSKKITPLQKFLKYNKLTTMTIYMPNTLKIKLKQKAKKTNERMNTIIIRGLEKELKRIV